MLLQERIPTEAVELLDGAQKRLMSEGAKSAPCDTSLRTAPSLSRCWLAFQSSVAKHLAEQVAEPNVISAEIAENLDAALEQFRSFAEELMKTDRVPLDVWPEPTIGTKPKQSSSLCRLSQGAGTTFRVYPLATKHLNVWGWNWGCETGLDIIKFL